MVFSLLMFSGSISLVSRYEGNWKPVPQACSRPFSQDDWSCVSFSYLCSALWRGIGGAAKNCLSDSNSPTNL